MVDTIPRKQTCHGCGLVNAHCISDLNSDFVAKRIAEGNLNEAIDVARVAWGQFPQLKESTNTKQLIELLMEGLSTKLNVELFVPLRSTTAAMTTIIDRLQNLVETNPSLIESGFNRSLQTFKLEMNNIKLAIQEPSARITELNGLLGQLLFKPVARGNAGESVLTELWVERFNRDQVERQGGSGRDDLLVRIYLDDPQARFGEPVSVERKTGKQKYTGSHREDAVRHARERGASAVVIVYDDQQNLPLSIQPLSLNREGDILVVIADLHTGTWAIAREMLGIIQRTMQSSGARPADINLQAIQEVVLELGNTIKAVEQIKASNARIRTCSEEVERNTITIRSLVVGYQEKLQKAVTCRVASTGNQKLV